MLMFHAGDVVWTCYGAGVIVSIRGSDGGGTSNKSTEDEDPKDKDQALDPVDPPRQECSGALNDDNHQPPDGVTSTTTKADSTTATTSTNNDDNNNNHLNNNKNNETATTKTYLVRLWRYPGKSVGSAALAFLQESTILHRLPVAPGMKTSTITKTDPPPAPPNEEEEGEREKVESGGGQEEKQKTDVRSHEDDKNEDSSGVAVLVHAYYPTTNTFLVSHTSPGPPTTTVHENNDMPSSNQDETTTTTKDREDSPPSSAPSGPLFWTVHASQLRSAPSAKFYPILETLMVRGDQTAQQATLFFQSEHTQAFLAKTHKSIQTTTTTLTNQAEQIVSSSAATALLSSSSPESAAASLQNIIPTEPQIKQVLTMVKDQELTELLQNCRERLEHLVQFDLPKATEQALLQTGIQIKMNNDDGDDPDRGNDGTINVKATFVSSLNASRQAALKALQDLLDQAQVDPNQLEQVQTTVTEQFSQTFDALATAAQSDRSLHDLFQSVADKTTLWQQSTGRLLETRSASLFLEGATRLQARAAAIFQMQWTGGGEIGSQLTKAFTEKDAALTRLKSIELGDAVKKRLVEAIEVRTDSLGGLDGIIAGALAKVRTNTTGTAGDLFSGNQLKSMLNSLQATASTATADAHETLISVLSSRSMYRDVALLRIEQVFCELSSQFGDDWSPEDIAAVARGEGGTAKLLQPIAQRAVEQIEKQLNAAESQITDPTMKSVLQRVRKITSGELTIAALTEELVGILNDERIVSASETLVQHGEHVLDAIEGVSSNKVVNDAMKLVEKAGITKDVVWKEIEKLNVDELLDTAGSAVTDETKRLQLLSSATDTALDFILRILPSMPVPPFDGARDGLVYTISNLSLEGFQVRKEDIQIELAGMRATKRRGSSSSLSTARHSKTTAIPEEEGVDSDGLDPESSHSDDRAVVESFDQVTSSVKATELLIIDVRRVSAILNNAAWSFEQTYMPYLKGSGLADIKLSGGAIRLQFELRRRAKTKTTERTLHRDGGSSGDDDDDEEEENSASLKAMEWEPVLCLHDRTCTISEVELQLQGEGRLTWIFNKLASIFKGALRDYVVRTIVRILTSQSGWILGQMNTILSPYWDLILKTAKLKMEDLVEADDEVVVTADGGEDKMLVELVWRERLPLGMNLLTNDDSGQLKVVDFPRGSQARLVCEKRNLTPELFQGATIVAVNGTTSDNPDELFDALKDPARPKTIQFRLAESEEWERVRRFVEGDNGKGATSSAGEEAEKEKQVKPRELTNRVVEFQQEGELGIIFAPALDNCGLIVDGFLEGKDGIVLAAERSNEIQVGDLLTHVNGQRVVSVGGGTTSGEEGGTQKSWQILEAMASQRPLSLTFSRSYLFREIIRKPEEIPGMQDHNQGGPEELILADRLLVDDEDEKNKNDDSSGTTNSTTTIGRRRRRVVIEGFNPIIGAGELSGVLIGDHLVFVNGTPVGAGARWLGESQGPTLDELYEMLGDPTLYPIGLTFARPSSGAPGSTAGSSNNNNNNTTTQRAGSRLRSRLSSLSAAAAKRRTAKTGQTEPFSDFDADTICVTCERQNGLGLLFDTTEHGDIVITDFTLVPGLWHRQLSRYNELDGKLQIAIDSINGQFVPSYVTKDLVMNALKRSWKNDKRVEIILCDDERKQFIQSHT